MGLEKQAQGQMDLIFNVTVVAWFKVDSIISSQIQSQDVRDHAANPDFVDSNTLI